MLYLSKVGLKKAK